MYAIPYKLRSSLICMVEFAFDFAMTMYTTRDLRMKSAASHEEAIGAPAQKKRKTLDKIPSKVIDECFAAKGTSDDRSTQAVVVIVSDEAFTKAQSSDNDAIREALTLAPGIYWLVHGNVNGKLCCRQEPSELCNNHELFIFWRDVGSESGWYLAEKPFNTEAELAQTNASTEK